MYSCAIADILEEFAGVEHTVILGDTTFGACCVDDFSAKAMEVSAPYTHIIHLFQREREREREFPSVLTTCATLLFFLPWLPRL